jgi:hypothetical protein
LTTSVAAGVQALMVTSGPSCNGHEWDDRGFHDFLETEAILGCGP